MEEKVSRAVILPLVCRRRAIYEMSSHQKILTGMNMTILTNTI
jgi:hypothetical protein